VALTLCNGILCNDVSPSRFSETPYNQKRTEKRENGPEPSRKYLFFGGISSPFLGLQIFGIVLVGFGFACLGVFGIALALDDPDRKRRILGWICLCIGGAGGLFLYGWAWGGNPWLVWGPG
jgi:hypothetical protein